MLPESEPRPIKELIFNENQDPEHPAIETPGTNISRTGISEIRFFIV